jgi:hypothetical protein
MFFIEKSIEIHGVSKIHVRSRKIYVFMDKDMAVVTLGMSFEAIILMMGCGKRKYLSYLSPAILGQYAGRYQYLHCRILSMFHCLLHDLNNQIIDWSFSLRMLLLINDGIKFFWNTHFLAA